jgi:hypothetical protein
VDALATLVMDTHRTHARTSAHTWWHERHTARGDDDVLSSDLSTHIHTAGQAILDGVCVYKLGLANKDVLGGAREGVGGSRQRGLSSAQQREKRERKSVHMSACEYACCGQLWLPAHAHAATT